jgi:hypothetical protein
MRSSYRAVKQARRTGVSGDRAHVAPEVAEAAESRRTGTAERPARGPSATSVQRARARVPTSTADAGSARLGARAKRGYNEGLDAIRFIDGGRGTSLL